MSFIDSCAKMTQLRKLTASAPLPLSAVLIGVVLVPFFITIAVIGWYSIQVLEERTHQRMQKDIELIARAIQLPLSHALANNQQGTIKRALESAFAINRVYGIYVYDRQGNPIYVGGKRVAMDKKRAQGLAQTKDQQSEFVRAGSEKLFSFYIPLVDPGQRIIGLLQLTRRGSDFDAYLATVRNQSLVVIVITTLALSLIILFGHRWVVGRHLARIKHSLSKIKTQDATHRLTPSGPRELRMLTADINAMLNAIDRSYRELAIRRESEAALKERLYQTEKLAALGQLAAGVAHELGSPLSIIDGRAQRALRDTTLPKPLAQALQTIRQQTSRMESTIRQLLDYGRRNPLTTRTVAAAQPLLSALKTVETETNHCGDKKVTVEMAAPARTTKIRIDPLRLEQALLNLVRNAMYAAHNNLTVGCSVSQDNILYWVQDDGPGIPAEALPHLFEPFFTTKPTGQGNGLGLAVAQAAANDHQGSIEIVENAPGCTRFHLILPRTEGTPK